MAVAKLFVIFTKDSELLRDDVYKRLLGELLFIIKLFLFVTKNLKQFWWYDCKATERPHHLLDLHPRLRLWHAKVTKI